MGSFVSRITHECSNGCRSHVVGVGTGTGRSSRGDYILVFRRTSRNPTEQISSRRPADFQDAF